MRGKKAGVSLIFYLPQDCGDALRHGRHASTSASAGKREAADKGEHRRSGLGAPSTRRKQQRLEKQSTSPQYIPGTSYPIEMSLCQSFNGHIAWRIPIGWEIGRAHV